VHPISWLEVQMQPRKRRKWTPRLRRWVIKQWKLGITPLAEIARNRGISRRLIYMLIDWYTEFGFEGLDPLPRGRKKDSINPNFEQYVLQIWADLPRGSHKMWLFLKEKGFSVSQRKIQQIYNEYSLKMNTRKRPSQIKFVTYEWPKPNMLWHTDWTECPFTGMQLIAFIDDHSRYIVHAEYFSNATAENTVLALNAAIQKYGKPENILTDNGIQFHPNGAFGKMCNQFGINHILGRVHHPQTNGKIERWFGTYKMEFQPQRWNLDEFVQIYNEKRLHQGIGYKKPIERYKCVINSV
jgi:putative transposase